jgi:hypothetical protein
VLAKLHPIGTMFEGPFACQHQGVVTRAFESVESSAPPPERDPTTHKRYANALIHEGLRALPRSEAIAFFCECSAAACFETVWLSGEGYDELRGNPARAIIRPGHASGHRVAP